MVGTTLSHYKILEHLGSGGMGVVYKAEDTRLKRTVALKFLPPEFTRDTRAKQRFMREAQTASAIQHNNICTIHDIDDTDDGRMFIVMDCYDGETLDERLERQSLSLQEISDIASQIARGMIVAHERGIIHRDLKPSNIFLTRDGVVKIFDFGLAKLLGSQGITREGRTSGTVLYMSPEQLGGDEVDSRADIWAFGVTLYRMLTGRLPFTADYEQALVFKIMSEPPQAISSLRADAPAKLIEVTEHCLEKDPALRPQSMTEVLEKISGVPVPPPPRPLRRIALLLGLGLASVALILYLARGTLFPPSPAAGGPLKLAVLLFANQTSEPEIDVYRAEIQNRFVGSLDNVDSISVEDGVRVNDIVREHFGSDTPLRTNELYAFLWERGYGYVVEGSISRSSQGGYSILVTCKDTRSYETHHEAFTRPPLPKEQLTQASADISEEVLAYLTVGVLDVKPEMAFWERNHRYRNWTAFAELNRAYESFMRADNKTARLHLERAISLDSAFISPRIWLAPSLRNERGAASANSAALARLRTSADDIERAVIDWVTALDREDYAEGIRSLHRALQYDSTNRIVLANLAGTYLSAGDTAHGLAVYDRLIRSKWNFPGIYGSAVRCVLSQRNYTAAEQALMLWRSVDTTATSSMLFGWLSALHSGQGDSAQAQECRMKFEALCNAKGYDSSRTRYYLGGCYADFGLFRQSERLLRSAVSGDSGNSTYRARLGDVLIAIGDTASGFEEYQTALRLNQPSKALHYKLGVLFEKKGDAKGARDHYRRFLLQDSTSVEARRLQERLNRHQP